MKNTITNSRTRHVLLVAAVSTSLLLTACASTPTTSQSTAAGNTSAATVTTVAGTTGAAESTAGALELTLEELTQYNGQNGQPVFVAVDGVIYDFSDLAKWEGGEHNGQVAGKDLTQAIDELSPHGRSMLERAKIVGRLVASK